MHPHFPSTINTKRVRWYIVRLWLVMAFAIIANYLVATGIIYFFIPTRAEIFPVLAMYPTFMLLSIIMRRVHSAQAICAVPLLEELSLPGFEELWKSMCLRYGLTPGTVHFPFDTEDSLRPGSIASVLSASLFESRPTIFIQSNFVSTLTRRELCAVLEHELGHMRAVFPLWWFVAHASTLVGDIMMSNLVSLRYFSLSCGYVRTSDVLWRIERILFWGTSRAFMQQGEYAADALASEACGESLTLLSVLYRAKDKRSELFGIHNEDHLQTHPSLKKRAHSLLRLRS